MTDLRGIRNNNPGNIDKGQPWKGLAANQYDSRFCTFIAPEYGIRALHLILQTYQSKYSLKTIREIISRWAPPRENDTESYIQHVAKFCGVKDDTEIDVMDSRHAMPLVDAIIAHENAGYTYPEEVVWKGLQLAGVQV